MVMVFYRGGESGWMLSKTGGLTLRVNDRFDERA